LQRVLLLILLLLLLCWEYLVLLTGVMTRLLCRRPAAATTSCDGRGASVSDTKINKGHSGYLNIIVFCSYIWIIRPFEGYYLSVLCIKF